MKIIYIHHALRQKGSKNPQDDGIKKIGKKDAKVVAKILKEAQSNNLNIKAIYSSPFNRCIKTSKIINKYIKLNIIEESRFNEFKSIENETWTDLQNRVREALYDIICKYKENESVVCVTSGVNVVAFISLVYKLEPSENTPFIGIPSCSPIIFEINKENFKLS